MLITYAITKYYVNNSNSDNGSDIIKMVKTFYVGRQTRARLGSIKKILSVKVKNFSSLIIEDSITSCLKIS